MPLTRYGNIDLVESHDETDVIFRFLQRYGEWAFIECEFIAGLLGDGANIFDLGAYLGTFSLGINCLCKVNSCLLAEVNPHCWKALESNVAANMSTANVFKGAVSTRNADSIDVKISWEKNNLGTASIVSELESSASIQVPSRTISGLAADYFKPDLIKLDLEGAELEALKHSTNWMKANMPLLWIECNEHPQSLEILSWMKWMGYTAHYFAFPAFNPDNFNDNQDDLYPFAYEAGLLAMADDNEMQLSESLAKKNCFLKKINTKSELKRMMWLTPRWGTKEWSSLSRVELVALLTHFQKGVLYKDFLT